MRKFSLVLLAIVLVSSFALAAKVDPAVMDAMKNNEKVDCIIVFEKGKSVNLNGMGKVKYNDLWVINGKAATLPVAAINALAKNPNIKQIQLDGEMKATLDLSKAAANYEATWASGYTGAGVTIAIVDTGIAPHPDFEGRLVAFKDFVNGNTDFYDDNGHGTHCAGDAAGNGFMSNGDYKGPAYEANLVGVKVLNRRGSGTFSDIIAGVQWCIDNKNTYSIDIVSMSLGGTATVSYTQDSVCQAVEAAWNAGLVVLVSAGNEGPDAGTIGTPGIDPMIITVGATNDAQTATPSDDYVVSFSSRGPTIDGLTKPDVVAPGTYIMSTKNDRNGTWRRGYYQEMSGTSMATPIAAGIVALMLDANPNMTPDQIKSKLMSTATDLGVDANTQGAGYINAYDATH